MDFMNTELIHIDQVARKFGVAVRTVRGWTRRQRDPLKSWKIGGQIFTTKEAIDEFAQPQHQPYEYSPSGSFQTAEDARRNAAAIAKLKAKHNRRPWASKEDIDRCKENSQRIQEICGRSNST